MKYHRWSKLREIWKFAADISLMSMRKLSLQKVSLTSLKSYNNGWKFIIRKLYYLLFYFLSCLRKLKKFSMFLDHFLFVTFTFWKQNGDVFYRQDDFSDHFSNLWWRSRSNLVAIIYIFRNHKQCRIALMKQI